MWYMYIYIYMLYAHTHIHTMEYYAVLKEKVVLPFMTTWMDLESIKWNKSDKKSQIPYDFICR